MSLKLILWIMTGLIITIALYLVIIYIISKSFRSYPGYLNIILSLVIALDNILRLIGIGEKQTVTCYFQALFLAIFDKLIFTSLTINSFLTFVGVTKYDFYNNKIKLLFIMSNLIGLFISLAFGIIFTILAEPESYENVCYVNSSKAKETTDTIMNMCLYLLYLYCNIKLLLYLGKVIKELFVTNQKTENFSSHFFRIFISIIITSAAFLVEILIINDSLFFNDDLIDLCYIIICLVIDLYNTFNLTVIKETINLFCRKKNEDQNKINKEETNIDKNKESGETEDINEKEDNNDEYNELDDI